MLSAAALDRRQAVPTPDKTAPGIEGATAPEVGAVAGGRSTTIAGLLQAAAALVWLPQAAALAWAIQRIASGGGPVDAIWPAIAIVALGFLRAALDAAGARIAFRSARARLTTLRQEAARALAQRSPLDRERPASGMAASLLAEQAEAVLPYLVRFQPVRLRAALVPLVFLLAVLPFSWIAALILLVAAPLIPLFMALIGLKAKEASEARMLEVGGMNGFLLDRLRGLATIRTLDAVDATAIRLRDLADSLRQRTMAVLRIAFLSSAVLELFAALGVALVAVYVGFHLLGQLPFGAWGDRLTLGQGLFILLLAPAFFEPLRELAAVWHDRAAGEAALAALARLGSRGMPLPGALAAPGTQTPARPPAIRLEQVHFQHAGTGRTVLQGFDLTIRAGERVAVLGPSGSGKSTLLALLAGLAALEAGRITIGGVALTAASAPALRARIAWIGPKPHLFAGSVRSNVALGRAGIGLEEASRALAMAAWAGDPRRRVGEGGAGLSGGEALRLALARAAAGELADIILADEPTAHLDAATAAEVGRNLLALAQGRTLVIATHDETLAADMDRVVRLGASS